MRNSSEDTSERFTKQKTEGETYVYASERASRNANGVR